MYLYVPNKSRHPWRLAAVIAGIVVVIVLAFIFGPKGYERWQIHRLMKEGNAKMQAAQWRESITPLLKVLAMNPNHLLANRMIADAIEKLGSPETLVFREKALQIDPVSLEDATHLVTAALAFENVPKAEQGIIAIQKIPSAPPALLPSLKAQLAVLKGDSVAAEKEFAQALQTDPGNPALKVSLAGLQIDSPDSDVRAAALEVRADEDQRGVDDRRGSTSLSCSFHACGRGDFQPRL